MSESRSLMCEMMWRPSSSLPSAPHLVFDSPWDKQGWHLPLHSGTSSVQPVPGPNRELINVCWRFSPLRLSLWDVGAARGFQAHREFGETWQSAKTRFSQFVHFSLAVKPWTNHLNPWSFSFLVSKIELKNLQTLKAGVRIRHNPPNRPSTCSLLSKCTVTLQ